MYVLRYLVLRPIVGLDLFIVSSVDEYGCVSSLCCVELSGSHPSGDSQ